MKAQFIEKLNAAVKKNVSLRNAAFYKKVDNSIFDNDGHYTEGVFIALESGNYDWAQTHYLGEPGFFQKVVVLGSTMYTYFSGGSEEQDEWEKSAEEAFRLEDMIGPLLENTLEKEHIKSVQSEKNADLKYRAEFSETYYDSLKQIMLESIRQVITQMDEKETDFIHAAKEQMKVIQGREYIRGELLIVINKDGYLVKFEEYSTYKEKDTGAEEITIYQEYRLKDYNIDNPTHLFPEIGVGEH